MNFSVIPFCLPSLFFYAMRANISLILSKEIQISFHSLNLKSLWRREGKVLLFSFFLLTSYILSIGKKNVNIRICSSFLTACFAWEQLFSSLPSPSPHIPTYFFYLLWNDVYRIHKKVLGEQEQETQWINWIE